MRGLKGLIGPALVLAFSLPLMSAQAQQGGMDERAVVSGKSVWIVLPPELVAEPQVSAAKWSHDGQFVVAVRNQVRITPQAIRQALGAPGARPPAIEGRNAIVVWSRRDGTSQEVWRRPAQSSNIGQVEWLPGRSAALAVVTFEAPGPAAPQTSPMRRAVLRIDGPSGTAKPMGEVDASEPFWLSVSPAMPAALVWHATRAERTGAGAAPIETDATFVGRETLTIVRASGGVVPVDLPPGRVAGPPSWTTDGQAVLAVMPPSTEPGKPAEPVRYLLNPATGRWGSAAGTSAYQAPQPAAGPVSIKQTSAVLKEGTVSRAVRPVWLEAREPGDPPRALVCSEADWATLSPTGDAVLYSSQGSAWVAGLVSLPAQVVEDARTAARRTMALSNAKQLGLALLMYAQDFDGKLPSDSEYSNGLISPYIKNDALFQGFTYTFQGGKMSDIASPAETQLGFTLGPGGRAVIYADGHVKWQAD